MQKRNRSYALILGSIVLVVLGLFIYAGDVVLFAFSATDPGSSKTAIVEIYKKQTGAEIARLLVNQGIVQDAHNMLVLGKFMRQWRKIKAGEYKLSPAMTPIEVFSVITSGVSMAHPVTLKEGENIYELAADFEEKKLATQAKILALLKDNKFMAKNGFKAPYPPTLEGYLYPETYNFNKSMSPEEMLGKMTKHFWTIWNDSIAPKLAQLPEGSPAKGMSMHEVVTLASIIEKETGASSERPKISSVFHNRLRKKMRLQSDPTTIYGMWERYEGNIHREDLQIPSPYNTYTLKALPVGAICSPGKEAMLAAIEPEATEFLYFVSRNDGTHVFSKTLQEHNQAVADFQKSRRAREGHSWREQYEKEKAIKAGGSAVDAKKTKGRN